MKISISPIHYKYQPSIAKAPENIPEPPKENISFQYITYPNINFRAKTQKIEKVMLENPEIQKVVDKISLFLEKIPQNFTIKKPITTKVDEDIVGFTIDRKDELKTKIEIKLKKFSDKIENWDSRDEFESILSMVLNKNGQMIEGTFSSFHSFGMNFERKDKNVRRLTIGSETYYPIAGTERAWKMINKNERVNLNSDPFINYKLKDLFCEMTKLNTRL